MIDWRLKKIFMDQVGVHEMHEFYLKQERSEVWCVLAIEISSHVL